MKRALASVAAVVFAAVVALASGTPIGANNSENAALCQVDWETLVDPATGVAFGSRGACVSYGARGGAIGATTANVAACESVEGTFGADNQTTEDNWDAVLWTCNNYWAESEPPEERNREAALLAQSCMDDSPVPNTHLATWDDATFDYAFTCGLLDPFNA